MNHKKVSLELKKKYPGKNIVYNNKDNPTEIICEVEPAGEHPEYSVAIAIIDKSVEHHHRETTEVYKVLKGKLEISIDGNKKILEKGDVVQINPGQKHFVKGNETWVEATSKPGWCFSDHILVET